MPPRASPRWLDCPEVAPDDPIWQTGPGRPLLAEGVVHVWHVRLETVPEELLDAVLTPDEQRRGDGIVDPRRGLMWKRSRAVLRELLGRYTGRHPAGVSIVTARGGKPALGRSRLTASATPREGAELRFNLSHSRGVALYAFALTTEVGVDVERLRPGRGRELLTAWTRHEASVKWRGLSVFSAAGHPADGSHADCRPADGHPADESPWIAGLPAGEHEVAALAVGRCPREVCWFEWRARPAEEGRSEDPDGDRLGEGFPFLHRRQHEVRPMALS